MVGIVAAVLAAAVPAVAQGAAGADDVFPASVRVGGSGPGELSSPKALDSGRDGRIYVADTGNHRVQVFWENGTFFRQFGSYGSGPGQFSSPEGIYLYGSTIFVADTGNHRVQAFHHDGTLLHQFGSYGSGPGQFSSPEGISGGYEGYHVADTGNHRVQGFRGFPFEYVYQFGSYGSGHGPPTPWGVTGCCTGSTDFTRQVQLSSPGGIDERQEAYAYIADAGNHRVHRLFVQTVGDDLAIGRYSVVSGSYGSGDFEYKGPKDVSSHGAAQALVADTGNHRIKEISLHGYWDRLVRQFGSYGSGPGQLLSPEGVYTRGVRGDRIFVADTGNHRVQAFNLDGTFSHEFGSDGATVVGIGDRSGGGVVHPDGTPGYAFGSYGSGPAHLAWPSGVALGPAGELAVADWGNHRVQVFHANGTPARTLGAPGPGGLGDAGRLGNPDGVAFGPFGELAVADSGNHRVQVFHANGTPARTLGAPGAHGPADGQFYWPSGVAFGPFGELAVADSGNHRVQVFHANGTPARTLGAPGAHGPADGQFYWPSGVAFGPFGELAVADSGNHRVQVFDPDGEFYDAFGSHGQADGQFYWPSGVAFGPFGEIAVADSGNHRVQAFYPNGTFGRVYGSHGQADGQFFYPVGVAFGPAGEIVVADSGNHRVQAFGRG